MTDVTDSGSVLPHESWDLFPVFFSQELYQCEMRVVRAPWLSAISFDSLSDLRKSKEGKTTVENTLY